MGLQTFLAFSCSHCPLHDKTIVRRVADEIANRRPDVVVHLGDLHEADSASRWPSEYEWALEDEFESARELLKMLREAYPPARRVFLPGNHDDNMLTLNRFHKKLRSLLDYRRWEADELQHWEQPAEYVYDRVRGVFRLGQVTFAHGYEANPSADEMQSITLGVPFGLYVGGHTHKPLFVTQAKRTQVVDLPYWFANPGTIRDMIEVPYMYRKRRHKWGQGIVVGEAATWESRSFAWSKFMPSAPQWSAETIVFRMYNDVVS